MKKIQRNKTPLIISVLLLLILGVIGFLYFSHLPPFANDESTSSSTPTAKQREDQKQTELTTKEAYIKSGQENPPSPAPVPESDSSITLSASRSDNQVIVTTKLKGFSGGDCRLHIQNGSRTIDQNATILYQPEYSTCAGFAIPVDDLGFGTWKIELTATPTGGKDITKTIEYGV